MVILGLGLRFVQETRADAAAAKLKAMITVTATVVRDGEAREIPISSLSLATSSSLSAGDMIPADVRLISAKDLFVIQATLTGESLPVEKFEVARHAPGRSLAGAPQHLLPRHERRERRGHGSRDCDRRRTLTSVAWPAALPESKRKRASTGASSEFTWLMIRFMLVMVPLVFVINGLTKAQLA